MVFAVERDGQEGILSERTSGFKRWKKRTSFEIIVRKKDKLEL